MTWKAWASSLFVTAACGIAGVIAYRAFMDFIADDDEPYGLYSVAGPETPDLAANLRGTLLLFSAAGKVLPIHLPIKAPIEESEQFLDSIFATSTGGYVEFNYGEGGPNPDSLHLVSAGDSRGMPRSLPKIDAPARNGKEISLAPDGKQVCDREQAPSQGGGQP